MSRVLCDFRFTPLTQNTSQYHRLNCNRKYEESGIGTDEDSDSITKINEMSTKVNIVENYKHCEPKKRINLIYQNYPYFEDVIKGYREGLIYEITASDRTG